MEDTRVVKFTQKHYLQDKVLPNKCIDLLITLHNQFHFEIISCLYTSQKQLSQYDNEGRPLRQRPDTLAIREHPWLCDNQPKSLAKRMVEITAPPLRRQVVNGLNSAADVFMADFDDAMSPTWPNILAG